MDWKSAEAKRNLARFAWTILALNLAVIVWGAYVRASFSGDGCGAHWPTCGGQILPSHVSGARLVEFTHRLTSGVDIVGTGLLVVWAFLSFPKGHAVRRYALLSVVTVFIEALLGAGLVLFRLVAHDQSAGRAWSMALHLTNTMLLLAAYTITAWLAQRDQATIRLANMSGKLKMAVLTAIAVSISGAVAALGDTLFPATSLANGVAQDFARDSSLLLKLRLVHPGVAILSAIYLLWASMAAMQNRQDGDPLRTAGLRVAFMVLVQVSAGFVNIYLLAPVWMQLAHLLIADVLWISVVLLICEEVRGGVSAATAVPEVGSAVNQAAR